MASQDLDHQSQGGNLVSKFATFLISILKPLKQHPDAYVYIACIAIGALGAVVFAAMAGFQETASQFFMSGSFWFLVAGVVCSLGWVYRPRQADLKDLQQIRNFRTILRKSLTFMITKHVRRCHKHTEIFFERELMDVPENELEDRLDEYAEQYHDRWHRITAMLFGETIESDKKGEP